MIRYFIDANKLERQQLDFKMEETNDPRNYEILSNFFEAHNCTDYHTIPIVISEDEEEAVPAEESRGGQLGRPTNCFEIFFKKEKNE